VDTAFGDSAAFRLGYGYINQSLFTFLPLSVLVAFNALLVRVVVRAARQRQAMTSAAVTSSAAVAMTSEMTSGGDQQRITVMLICVVIVFIVCQVDYTSTGRRG